MTKKYTAREVQDALQDLTWEEKYESFFDYVDGKYTRLSKSIMKTAEMEFEWREAEGSVGKVYDVLGGVEVVASDPGGEGHGESIWVVVRVNETGQLFRIEGYYASYGDGSQYDGELREVKAQERTVIVYE